MEDKVTEMEEYIEDTLFEQIKHLRNINKQIAQKQCMTHEDLKWIRTNIELIIQLESRI